VFFRSAIPANTLYLRQYLKCNQKLLSKSIEPEEQDPSERKSPIILGNVFIHPTANVHPSAKIGPNVSIGQRVTIGKGVRVKESIILDNVEVKVKIIL
jgi:mannose-1-phosphate guanylyltransferase